MRIDPHTQFEMNGEVFVASLARGLVAQMNASSFQPCDTDQEYMAEVSERTTMQDGTKPRTDTFHHFVEDLIQDGLIRVLGCIE